MEHKINVSQTIKVTTDDIVCLLSCESGGFDYWCEICYDESSYNKARESLKSAHKENETICYEDVLAHILETGGEIIAYDCEEDEEHRLQIDDILDGFRANAEHYPNDASMEDGDADTADRILQYAVFGDVIYG